MFPWNRSGSLVSSRFVLSRFYFEWLVISIRLPSNALPSSSNWKICSRPLFAGAINLNLKWENHCEKIVWYCQTLKLNSWKYNLKWRLNFEAPVERIVLKAGPVILNCQNKLFIRRDLIGSSSKWELRSCRLSEFIWDQNKFLLCRLFTCCCGG